MTQIIQFSRPVLIITAHMILIFLFSGFIPLKSTSYFILVAALCSISVVTMSLPSEQSLITSSVSSTLY